MPATTCGLNDGLLDHSNNIINKSICDTYIDNVNIIGRINTFEF